MLDKKEVVLLQNESFLVWVAPDRGMNVEKIEYKSIDLIECDLVRANQGATYAVPILYPTPNRVENECFSFENQTVYAKMHGVAKNFAFEVVEKETARLTGVLRFEKESEAYSAFPFVSELWVTVELLEDSVRWTYVVKNKDEKTLPYGFALHPFFKKNGETKYQVFAHSVMEMNAEKLPNGICSALDGQYCVNRLRNTEAAILDDVFCVRNSPMARFFYENQDWQAVFYTSDEFQKCVVFTPPQVGWFCIEPQTSSTNCHNLHAAGFEAQANLQLVAPHSEKSGWVQLKIEPKKENEQ